MWSGPSEICTRVPIRGADPAGLRHVDGDGVGPGVLDLDVAAHARAVPHAERVVDVVAAWRARAGELVGDRFQVLDLEPDVVDAAPPRAPLDAGHRVVLEVQDREVEVAVGQVVATGALAVHLSDFLHAEHVDVELRGRVDVLARNGDVLDLRHGLRPSLARKGTKTGILCATMNLLRPLDRQFVVKGLNLHLLDWGGEGRTPLLLLHGFTGHAHAWDTLSIALQPHFHVYALDQRGHGDSDPADVYNAIAAFDDINGVIGELGITPPVLVGP